MPFQLILIIEEQYTICLIVIVFTNQNPEPLINQSQSASYPFIQNYIRVSISFCTYCLDLHRCEYIILLSITIKKKISENTVFKLTAEKKV